MYLRKDLNVWDFEKYRIEFLEGFGDKSSKRSSENTFSEFTLSSFSETLVPTRLAMSSARNAYSGSPRCGASTRSIYNTGN